MGTDETADEKIYWNYVRTLPWSRRAKILERFILNSIPLISKRSPDIDEEDLFRTMFACIKVLVKEMDDGEIASLDHAAVLMTFAPSRSTDAARWLKENAANDACSQWMAEHELISAFNEFTQPGASTATH